MFLVYSRTFSVFEVKRVLDAAPDVFATLGLSPEEHGWHRKGLQLKGTKGLVIDEGMESNQIFL